MEYEDARARECCCHVAGTAPLPLPACKMLQQMFLNEEPSYCSSKNEQTSFHLFKDSPFVSGHFENHFCLPSTV